MMQAKVAASGLVLLHGDKDAAPPATGLQLRLISQTASRITLGWVPVPGAVGYRFSSSASEKRSHTWDGTRDRITFSAGAAWYMVEALAVSEMAVYPPPTPSPMRALVAAAALEITR